MKITKLSLATIIALGSISFANAQNLEDAIKNVEVSGTVAYRYNDYEENNRSKKDDSSTSNLYKAAINLGTKVNDDVKFNSRFIAGNKTNAGEVGLDTQSTGDTNVDLFLSEVNFVYTGVNDTTFTLGKQALTTPFTVARDSIGNEQTGTGLLAMTNQGPITLAAGYFNQTNIGQSGGVIKDGSTFLFSDTNGDGIWQNNEPTTGSSNNGKISSKDVATVGIIATAGPVTMDAWYIDLQDVLDAYTVGVTGNFDLNELKLAPYARYSSLDLDSSNKDNTLWKTGIQANLGIFGAYIAYGQTNEEGGTVDLDGSSTTGMDDHWRVTLSGIEDASAIYASVDTQVTDTVNVALKYSTIDVGSKNTSSNDQSEIYAQVSYKMSKNLSTYARLGQYEVDNYYGANDDLESMMGRLHVQYSF